MAQKGLVNKGKLQNSQLKKGHDQLIWFSIIFRLLLGKVECGNSLIA